MLHTEHNHKLLYYSGGEGGGDPGEVAVGGADAGDAGGEEGERERNPDQGQDADEGEGEVANVDENRH